jgi:hypothetical protein
MTPPVRFRHLLVHWGKPAYTLFPSERHIFRDERKRLNCPRAAFNSSGIFTFRAFGMRACIHEFFVSGNAPYRLQKS